MTFITPWRLWFLVLVLVIAVVYILLQRRRRTYALRFSSSELFDSVATGSPGLRRHAPAGVFLVALAVLVTGLAQPAP